MKMYYLSTCDTCKRIMKETEIVSKGAELQDIKSEKITADQLEEMRHLAGSYEALFSRRSLQYKARGLKDKVLQEEDYKNLILEEYTFLKRPVVIAKGKIFVGNDKKVVEQLKLL